MNIPFQEQTFENRLSPIVNYAHNLLKLKISSKYNSTNLTFSSFVWSVCCSFPVLDHNSLSNAHLKMYTHSSTLLTVSLPGKEQQEKVSFHNPQNQETAT